MIGRRGVLGIGAMMLGRIPGGLPPMRPDQVAQLPQTRAGSGPAPQSTVVVARRVIVIGPNGGVYTYSPTTAAGNLVSTTGLAQGGTDQFGNAFLAGDTVYAFEPALNAWIAASLQAVTGVLPGLLYYSSPGPTGYLGPWTQTGGVVAGSIGGAPDGVQFLGPVQSAGGTAAVPTLITTDTTHGLGALGVANLSITTANFTLLPDGGCFISVKGSATGAVAGGSTAFPNSLPAQYTPATTTLLPAEYGGVIAAGENRPRLVVGASGQVTLVYPTLANGNTVSAGGRYDLQ